MRDDPLNLEALHHLVMVSADVEAQLRTDKGHQPIKAILARARDEAAAAMVRLIDVDPARADVVRALQTIVRRYASLVTWLREIIAEGEQASDEIDQIKSDYLGGLVLQMDDDTRRALGLKDGAPTE